MEKRSGAGSIGNNLYFFCTYFDQHYLPRGLTLYESLKRHCSSFRLCVLSLDSDCTKKLQDLNLAEVEVVDISELEKQDSELSKARTNRSLIEFYFTCTASWLLYLFKNFPEPEIITYVDADLFFFSDPALAYAEFGNASIGIVPHRFPDRLKELEKFGIYNVGYLSFRRDQNSDACLKWWRERCLEWCHDYLEGDKYADQKYLNEWPARFSGVMEFRHPGIGSAPWNIGEHRITELDSKTLIDSKPMIVYHFHGLKVLRPYLFESGLSPYHTELRNDLKKLYLPYLSQLRSKVLETGDKGQFAFRYRKEKAALHSKIAHNKLVLLFGGSLFEFHMEPLMRFFRRPRIM